jgi:superfamily II DNA helicase RecQ
VIGAGISTTAFGLGIDISRSIHFSTSASLFR